MISGEAGYRSLYLSHAKRALYHLSYIPRITTHLLYHNNNKPTTTTNPPQQQTHHNNKPTTTTNQHHHHNKASHTHTTHTRKTAPIKRKSQIAPLHRFQRISHRIHSIHAHSSLRFASVRFASFRFVSVRFALQQALSARRSARLLQLVHDLRAS
jgi:hypothetical protein